MPLKLTVKSEDHRGTDMPVRVDMSMEPPESMWTYESIIAAVLALFCLLMGCPVPVEIRGTLESEDGTSGLDPYPRTRADLRS